MSFRNRSHGEGGRLSGTVCLTRLRWTGCRIVVVLGFLFADGITSPSALSSQTFVQLTDLGSNIGPRLTRTRTWSLLNRALFGAIGTKVSFISAGVVYQFATDPDWGRVLVGKKDEYIHDFTNSGGPGGPLGLPEGIDISARRNVYIADPEGGRVVVSVFDPNAENLVGPSVLSRTAIPRPVDVAWDGGTSPLSQDYIYVVDQSLSNVSYWDFNSGLPASPLWSYGGAGSGPGQFSRPSSVCVGKTPNFAGGTQFTTDFYVVDRGNQRVAWLKLGTGGLTWTGTWSFWGWDPADCAVDHFGNLYVIDESNHQMYKFTYSLELLAVYGTYGKGTTNYNTFAWPHAVSVPCGLKVVNSNTVWYCEGRVITAEQWSDSSGAVEHYLGIASSILAQPSSPDGGQTVLFAYKVTDHASQAVWVSSEDGAWVYLPLGFPHARGLILFRMERSDGPGLRRRAGWELRILRACSLGLRLQWAVLV